MYWATYKQVLLLDKTKINLYQSDEKAREEANCLKMVSSRFKVLITSKLSVPILLLP